MHFCNGWFMGGMWTGGFGIILLIGVLVWLAYSGRLGNAGPFKETPQDILKKRYARGEINQDEYEQKMKDLK